ncbi:hypothetical protein B194_4065 [Serratia plymuthica A30]|jgi:hypothetical protein|nr:hypothetical protein B194_4065 [Serratia plymuthica A30]
MASKTDRSAIKRVPAFLSGADYMCAVNACLRENQHFIKNYYLHSSLCALRADDEEPA